MFDAATKRYIASVDAYTKSVGQYKPFRYLNYAHPSQDAIASYGTRNVEFLRSVSRKYDREGVFQEVVPGGFKLGMGDDRGGGDERVNAYNRTNGGEGLSRMEWH